METGKKICVTWRTFRDWGARAQHVPHPRRPRWKFTKQPQVARQFFSLRGWRFCWCVFRFVVRKVRDTTVRKPLAPLFLLRPQFSIRAALTLRLRTTKKHRKNRQLRRWATFWQLQLFGATCWQLLMFGATWLNFWQLKGITASSYNPQPGACIVAHWGVGAKYRLN